MIDRVAEIIGEVDTVLKQIRLAGSRSTHLQRPSMHESKVCDRNLAKM